MLCDNKCGPKYEYVGGDFFLLFSHLRLSQRMDETDEGWLNPFYCHYTLPKPALKLITCVFVSYSFEIN